MAVLGLRFCARTFSSCGKRGPLFIAVHGPEPMSPALAGTFSTTAPPGKPASGALKGRKKKERLPGGPVVKTLCFHCRGACVQSLVGESKILHAAGYDQKIKKIKKEKKKERKKKKNIIKPQQKKEKKRGMGREQARRRDH